MLYTLATRCTTISTAIFPTTVAANVLLKDWLDAAAIGLILTVAMVLLNERPKPALDVEIIPWALVLLAFWLDPVLDAVTVTLAFMTLEL
jgi:antibiotic biosynthesis monooxygenase (ABM) superfamily enzyme